MRKLFKVLILIIFLVGCESGKVEKKTLRIFMPSEYIEIETIYEFEDMFNAKVILEEFESNEQMYTKLLAGNKYDILIPSDYMIDRLIKENKLKKIDLSYIENYEFIKPELLNLAHDPNNEYSVPYFYGSVGIAYDKTKVSLSELEREGWNIFRNPKYKGEIYFYDSERDAFMIALKALGYSMNTDNLDEIEEAYEWLSMMAKEMSVVYTTDTVMEVMLDLNRQLAVMYSGDAAYVLSENDDVGFFMPKEGTNIWTDALVISNDVIEEELALEFINFTLDYDIAYLNSETVGYSTPVLDVYNDLVGEDGLFSDNIAYKPRLNYVNDETFVDIEVLRKAISEYWIMVKAK